MEDQPPRALSFDGVSDAYDRARPSYPREAVDWLVGPAATSVLELGAGTGKLTDVLLSAGHDVLATDPLDGMLAHLRARHPACRTAVAPAEQIPVPPRSVDVVVCAQAFHWFDTEVALPEIARVLKPEGRLGVVWNVRDDRIPWVRRLSRLIEPPDDDDRHPSDVLVSSRVFGFVEEQTFRFWHALRKQDLRDLVCSTSYVATMTPVERDRVLRATDALYDDYGRGPDGMLLPYRTHCFRAVVRPVVLEDSGPIHLDPLRALPRDPRDDDGTPLFSLS